MQPWADHRLYNMIVPSMLLSILSITSTVDVNLIVIIDEWVDIYQIDYVMICRIQFRFHCICCECEWKFSSRQFTPVQIMRFSSFFRLIIET